MSKPKAEDENVNYGECVRCGVPLQVIGTESFRVGGTSGGWHKR